MTVWTTLGTKLVGTMLWTGSRGYCWEQESGNYTVRTEIEELDYSCEHEPVPWHEFRGIATMKQERTWE